MEEKPGPHIDHLIYHSLLTNPTKFNSALGFSIDLLFIHWFFGCIIGELSDMESKMMAMMGPPPNGSMKGMPDGRPEAGDPTRPLSMSEGRQPGRPTAAQTPMDMCIARCMRDQNPASQWSTTQAGTPQWGEGMQPGEDAGGQDVGMIQEHTSSPKPSDSNNK